MPDSLYHRLANIEAYLEYIVTNTRPINEIQEYSQISDGKISLIALGVSLFATVRDGKSTKAELISYSREII